MHTFPRLSFTRNTPALPNGATVEIVGAQPVNSRDRVEVRVLALQPRRIATVQRRRGRTARAA